MLLMKRASILEADRPFFRRPIFQVAFALFFFNTVVLDAVIYALAPLTVVAPITALGVVFVNIGVACGLFVDREAIGPLGLVANAMIVVGIAIASYCGPSTNTSPTIEEMYASALSPRFLCYALPGLTIALSCVVCLFFKLLPPRSHVKVIWVAVSSAVFGSLSVLSFKGVATSVRLTLAGDDQLHTIGMWLLLLSAAICAPANVTLMNLTFEESDATMGMPLYQALLILATIVSGGLFYDEFGAWAAEVGDDLGVIFGFITGVVILILGIVLVAQRPTAGGASAGATSTKGGATAVSPIVSPTGGGASPDYVRLL